MERTVQADSQMALAFFQEPFQAGYDTYRGKGDPGRAPAESPGRGHGCQRFQYIVGVVQGFSHAHDDDVA